MSHERIVDARVQLVAAITLCYILACLFGDRVSALQPSAATANLRPNSDAQLTVEEGAGNLRAEHDYPAVLTPFFFLPVPVNSADREMLMTVKGIGPSLADQILASRLEAGPFRSLADLAKLPGIGAKRAASLASSLRFDDDP
jgi:DNA uptake protein ComE-like DNA-binding protein